MSASTEVRIAQDYPVEKVTTQLAASSPLYFREDSLPSPPSNEYVQIDNPSAVITNAPQQHGESPQQPCIHFQTPNHHNGAETEEESGSDDMHLSRQEPALPCSKRDETNANSICAAPSQVIEIDCHGGTSEVVSLLQTHHADVQPINNPTEEINLDQSPCEQSVNEQDRLRHESDVGDNEVCAVQRDGTDGHHQGVLLPQHYEQTVSTGELAIPGLVRSPEHPKPDCQPCSSSLFDNHENLPVGSVGISVHPPEQDQQRLEADGTESARDSSQSPEHDATLDSPDAEASFTGDFVIPEGRVDIMTLPIMSNPLQKAGRHTVIRGRLPHDHPFSIAAENLGIKLVSREMCGFVEPKGDDQRREYFMADLNAFLREIDNRHTKIPVIGGGELDIYMLTKEVMLLGGVHNVVRKRAFRIVAQQLGIPKTCTSAASVLKQAYEKLLFHYEQRLTFGKWPDNPAKAVNMKDMVCEEKERERRARHAMSARVKRRVGEFSAIVSHQKRVRPASPSDLASPADITSPFATADTVDTAQWMSLIKDAPTTVFELPEWARNVFAEQGLKPLIEAAHRLDISRVRSGNDVIVLAMAECFDPDGADEEDTRSAYDGPDFCLAGDLCRADASIVQVRRAQAMLFNLLIKAAGSPQPVPLAQNMSAEGLLESLLRILREFHHSYLQSENKKTVWETNAAFPFLEELEHDTKQVVATAYCSIRVLAELTREPRNRPRLLHKDCLLTFSYFLLEPSLHRSFLLCILEALERTVVIHATEEDEQQVVNSLLKGLLSAIHTATNLKRYHGAGPNSTDASPKLDFVTSDLALRILAKASHRWRIDGMCLQQFLETFATLLLLRDRVQDVASLAKVTYNLAIISPKTAGAHATFVPGVIQLLCSGKCIDVATETLRVIHGAHSLQQFTSDIRKRCPWHLLTQAQVRSLLTVFADALCDEDGFASELQAHTEKAQCTGEQRAPILDIAHLGQDEAVENASVLDSLFEQNKLD